MARLFEREYRLREGDDVLDRLEAILRSLDMRTDAIEILGAAFAAGNRLDVDALLKAISEDIALKSAAIQALIDEVDAGFTPDRITETAEKRFTSDAEQQAHVDGLAEANGRITARVTNATFGLHTSNTSNPHNVTAEQVGAATPDQVAAAIADKADVSAVYTKTEANDLLAEKVPTTRSITAGNGLAGGGSLAADRSLSIDTTHNAVGTYALLRHGQTASTLNFGDFRAGSNLQPANAGGVNSPGTLGGTWKCMGQIGSTNQAEGPNRTTLFLRVA